GVRQVQCAFVHVVVVAQAADLRRIGCGKAAEQQALRRNLWTCGRLIHRIPSFRCRQLIDTYWTSLAFIPADTVRISEKGDQCSHRKYYLGGRVQEHPEMLSPVR